MRARLDRLLADTCDERFAGPLLELVALGLFRPSFDALLAGEPRVAAPRVDRAFLHKILHEEIGRQFGDPLRPVVELVLNAIDAHTWGRAEVTIRTAPDTLVVADRGSGMSLGSLVSRLLIPFSTEKVAGRHLGRFGVGFFSLLGLAALDPARFSLRIDTSDGTESWALGLLARGADPWSFSCSIRRSPRVEIGTHVAVESPALDPAQVAGYLVDLLHFFPDERAVILLDGAQLNACAGDGRGATTHVEIAEGGRTLRARFRLPGEVGERARPAGIYSMGVRVEASESIDDEILVDFPPEVELTQGRDALRPGPAHGAVCEALHLGVATRGARASRSLSERCHLASSAAQMSAILLGSSGWAASAPRVAGALLGASRHLVGAERAGALLAFLGAWAEELLFVPAGFWAEREWAPHLPGERELLHALLEVDPPCPLGEAARRRPELRGLRFLLAASPEAAGTVVILCRAAGAAGPVPILGSPRGVLVRDDASAVRDAANWHDRYVLRAAFERARGRPEPDVERDLILGDGWDA